MRLAKQEGTLTRAHAHARTGQHTSDKEIAEMQAAADQMLYERYIKQQTAQEMPKATRLNFDF